MTGDFAPAYSARDQLVARMVPITDPNVPFWRRPDLALKNVFHAIMCAVTWNVEFTDEFFVQLREEGLI